MTLELYQYQCFALIHLLYQPDPACLLSKGDLHLTPTTKLKKNRPGLLIGGCIKSNIEGDLRANTTKLSQK